MSGSGGAPVLALGAHPDDVELGCGGTLARLVAAGVEVHVAHLTRGERGTRGDAETREQEARRAGEILGAAAVHLLDCGDGGLRTGEAEEDQVIHLLREVRPELVLYPTPADRHPDHERAHRLVRDACFYAGLQKRAPAGRPPHRPATQLCYPIHVPVEPTLVVDVTATWETKIEALRAHRSQFAGNGDHDPDGPETPISRAAFWSAIEGRARAAGQRCGVALGEAFWAAAPLRVGADADLAALLGALG